MPLVSARSHPEKLVQSDVSLRLPPRLRPGVHSIPYLGSAGCRQLWGHGPSPRKCDAPGWATTPWQVAASCVEAEISNGTLENSLKKSRLTLISNQEYNLRQVTRVVRHSFISEVLCNLRFHKRWSFPCSFKDKIEYCIFKGEIKQQQQKKTSQMPQNKKVT